MIEMQMPIIVPEPPKGTTRAALDAAIMEVANSVDETRFVILWTCFLILLPHRLAFSLDDQASAAMTAGRFMAEVGASMKAHLEELTDTQLWMLHVVAISVNIHDFTPEIPAEGEE